MKNEIIIIILMLFFIASCSTQEIIKGTDNTIDDVISKGIVMNDTLFLRIIGNSMSPLYKDGDIIQVDKTYYNSKFPDRCDVVVIDHIKDQNPIIKRIFAIPNDTFSYINQTILINDQILRNSQGKNYIIDSEILELYSNEYPIIPEGYYLVFGENIYGSTDSSRIGLVPRADIIGYVDNICD